MTAVEKRRIKAAEYRRLAAAAGVMAENSLLAHVQAKHEEAEARWTALALLDERPRPVPPLERRSSAHVTLAGSS